MVNIFLENRQINFIDWTMRNKSDGTLMLTVTYPSGKEYTRPFQDWRVVPTVRRNENLLFHKSKQCFQQVKDVVVVGEKYCLITYPANEKSYLLRYDQIELVKQTDMADQDVFRYFEEIAKERVNNALQKNDRMIAENVAAQFCKIVSCEGTALSAYISKKIEKRECKDMLIYPFGINETQLEAVKKAFSAQVSIIEGPPGTGKTQTILNIIANIIVNKKTCAIISNNNSAVENVYEKMAEEELDFLIAKLGKGENQKEFFENIDYRKPEGEVKQEEMKAIKELINSLESNLSTKNSLARIKSEIEEIQFEKEHLISWHQEHPEIDMRYIEKYNLNTLKTADLMAFLKVLGDRTLKFQDKLELLLRHKIFKSKFLNNALQRESFIFSLQLTYYERLLKEKKREEDKIEIELKKCDFDNNLKKLTISSMKYFKGYIAQHMPDSIPDFSKENYRKNFHKFVQYFPVIGSSTHSVLNSIGEGYLLDYVIIDEASQQDIVPGILGLACAKNVVIVGDKKQLSHIPTATKVLCPDQRYDCIRYSLLDSVSEVFGNRVPQTMLKEHYRCHPRIIQYCNQQFYDNELIPMKADQGENALSLVTTALGNHMRNYKNQREIESVMKAQVGCGFLESGKNSCESQIGFIAPYNNQVKLAKELMPEEIVKDTIHKFQGRGCDEIIFSTVLDKKVVSKRQLDFVDNAALVNVAVSRAKNKFTLVTGNNVFLKSNKYIAALIRYIEYYAVGEEIHDSPVVSAFDLLYTEYDHSLDKLAARLKSSDSKFKSEQIATVLLRDVLTWEKFKMLTFHKQIYLKQLVSVKNDKFTEEELAYIKNRASCDFVIYYRIGKKPLAVIEIDGGYHDKPEQIERDRKKDSILGKAGIPILRIRTTDSEIEERMKLFIKECLGSES